MFPDKGNEFLTGKSGIGGYVMTNSIPNLFNFATSELSQDAFIYWLLSWAAPEYKKADVLLHACAIGFIKSLFEKHSIELPREIISIEVVKQDNNIDVLCVVNEEYVVIIEDKIGTKNHSNQLERYLEDVKGRGYDMGKILPIYFKTEEQSDYSDVLNKGYKVFFREDFLEVLNGYEGENSILIDYRKYLQSISDKVHAYATLPLEKWGWYSWVGFYSKLQHELNKGNWDYVSNPNGGFLGFWWNFVGDEECQQYLQLEQDKLCFKIWVNNNSERKLLREKWHKAIYSKGQECGLDIVRPKRFGNGEYMTVCIYDGDYRISHQGIIDFEKTIVRLRSAEELLESVCMVQLQSVSSINLRSDRV